MHAQQQTHNGSWLRTTDDAEKANGKSHQQSDTFSLARIIELPNKATLLRVSGILASRLLHLVQHILLALIPSFLNFSSRSDQKPERLRPTAYLDGMRGVAAFAVFLCHLSYQNFYITYGYGQGEPGENDYLIQLPIIRLFYSGPPQVALFFVISGYALSFKPIKQMRSQQWEGLMHTMSSSVFRRPFRLFLPCVISTLMVFVLVRYGVYEYTRPFAENNRYFPVYHEDHMERLETFEEQWYDWVSKMFGFVHAWGFWHFGGSVDYDRHLWTIPTEFRASMVLFLSLIMTARMTSILRIATFVGLQYWALQSDRWEMILFWAGPILAEIDQIRLNRQASQSTNTGNGSLLEPVDRQHEVAAKPARKHTWFWLANFIIGLYLASYPDTAGPTTPGYRYLSTYIPKYYTEKIRFWQSIGAIQIIYAVNGHDGLKSLFNGSIIQYLGKISYALYLMHGPVIHTFGFATMPMIMEYFGLERRFDYEVGFFVSAICTIIVTIVVSDLFWRVVDQKVVDFARALESRCIVVK